MVTDNSRNIKSIVRRKMSHFKRELWQDLLAETRFLYLWYQTCHWQTQGANYYADHLLFERLYKDALEEIDSVAERSIGICQDIQVVDIFESVQRLSEKSKAVESDMIQYSIKLEENFVAMLEELDKKDISTGTRDLINGIANKHEEHLYLLRQRQKS